MEGAYFTQQSTDALDAAWAYDTLSVYRDFQAFTASEERPHFLVIDYQDATKTERLIKQLRSDLRFYLIPMFLTHRNESAMASLADGVVQTFAEAQLQASRINAALCNQKQSSSKKAKNALSETVLEKSS